MILNEQDAKQKRCTPFAAAYLTTPTTERNAAMASGMPVSFNCIGSRCMQWRYVTHRPEGAGPVAAEHWGRGYCGLANPDR